MPEFLARNTFDAGAWYASLGGGPAQLRRNLARVIGWRRRMSPAT
jgi:KDO2-lipid IV(A) lauroyltransferase